MSAGAGRYVNFPATGRPSVCGGPLGGHPAVVAAEGSVRHGCEHVGRLRPLCEQPCLARRSRPRRRIAATQRRIKLAQTARPMEAKRIAGLLHACRLGIRFWRCNSGRTYTVTFAAGRSGGRLRARKRGVWGSPHPSFRRRTTRASRAPQRKATRPAPGGRRRKGDNRRGALSAHL